MSFLVKKRWKFEFPSDESYFHFLICPYTFAIFLFKDLCWMLKFINQMHPRIDRREWLLKSFQISWYRLWPHQSFTIPCVKKDIHQWTTTQCGTHVQNRTLTTWDIFHHHTDIPKTPPTPTAKGCQEFWFTQNTIFWQVRIMIVLLFCIWNTSILPFVCQCDYSWYASSTQSCSWKENNL